MFKGFKHAVKCVKCGEMKFYENYDDAERTMETSSVCCGVKQEYAGFQPYVDKVLVFAKPIMSNVNQPENTMNIMIDKTMVEPAEIPKMTMANKPVMSIPTRAQIDSPIAIGKRGRMTTLIMRDLVRKAVEDGNLDIVLTYKKEYPTEYNDCMRYLPAKIRNKLG